MTTLVEHLAWARTRAFEQLGRGDCRGAYSSFASDMMKHQGTATKETMGLLTATLDLLRAGATVEDMRGAIDVIVYRLTGEWPIG